jgi:hypothetical protein
LAQYRRAVVRQCFLQAVEVWFEVSASPDETALNDPSHLDVHRKTILYRFVGGLGGELMGLVEVTPQ